MNLKGGGGVDAIVNGVENGEWVWSGGKGGHLILFMWIFFCFYIY